MRKDTGYLLLPFNFKFVNSVIILLTNDSGEYYFIDLEKFDTLLSYSLSQDSSVFQDLKSRHFLSTNDTILSIELAATKLRSRKQFLNNFSALHMMVITLRCNHKCRYCQVSSEEDDAYKYDMKPETALSVVDTIFQSPSHEIKIEFQGGEPLLNWKAIVKTIEYAENLNKSVGKKLEFVVCTNLTLIDEQKLIYLNLHNVSISSSLDGPKQHHDKNRIMLNGESSYNQFTKKLDLIKEIIKDKSVGPLMTTTIDNIDSFPEVVDEYVKLGFDGIFFRALNPYGFASKNEQDLGYSIEHFLASYREGLNYIINLNLQGTFFVEHYTALLLSRILTPFSTGFVDLQSPSGAGISGVIYDYNGDVYPADEARMLARMGDKYFLMGNVLEDDYFDIFNGKVLSKIVHNSCVETLPACSSCVYNCYCGTDPIRNYLETSDIVGHRPTSDFCKKHMGMFDILFQKIKNNNEDEMNVFWSWLTNRSLKEIRCESNIG